MDRAGYFVITPDANRKVIVVEHYAYDNQLQHVIERGTSRDLYRAIIGGGWVTQLSHAAYLGKELATAELGVAIRLSLRPGLHLSGVHLRAVAGRQHPEVPPTRLLLIYGQRMTELASQEPVTVAGCARRGNWP